MTSARGSCLHEVIASVCNASMPLLAAGGQAVVVGILPEGPSSASGKPAPPPHSPYLQIYPHGLILRANVGIWLLGASGTVD